MQKQQKKLKDARLKEFDGIIKKANNCLDKSDFLEYKASYEAYQETVLTTLLDYPVNDPEYKMVCVKYLTELSVLRRLLKEVKANTHGR